MNKFHAKRTFSNLVGIWFSSKGECEYGEGLYLREKTGEISNLHFHTRFMLSKTPRCSIEVDFIYREDGKVVYEDFKGRMMPDYRVKRLWLKEQQNIDIVLIKSPLQG
uniref:DUF1064 domain-containing protein n=1 Tax=viral metagenome TaxID=1070528 RepID=A0A6M3KSV4_9ZZZZ